MTRLQPEDPDEDSQAKKSGSKEDATMREADNKNTIKLTNLELLRFSKVKSMSTPPGPVANETATSRSSPMTWSHDMNDTRSAATFDDAENK